jgi:hypothetical protein
MLHFCARHIPKLFPDSTLTFSQVKTPQSILNNMSDWLKTRNMNNVFLSRRRFLTSWGGISLVYAEMNAFIELLQMSPSWDWYINLSDTDYPVRSQSEASFDF